jgi:hypothetical protein
MLDRLLLTLATAVVDAIARALLVWLLRRAQLTEAADAA